MHAPQLSMITASDSPSTEGSPLNTLGRSISFLTFTENLFAPFHVDSHAIIETHHTGAKIRAASGDHQDVSPEVCLLIAAIAHRGSHLSGSRELLSSLIRIPPWLKQEVSSCPFEDTMKGSAGKEWRAIAVSTLEDIHLVLRQGRREMALNREPATIRGGGTHQYRGDDPFNHHWDHAFLLTRCTIQVLDAQSIDEQKVSESSRSADL